jgi:hypothetical protein
MEPTAARQKDILLMLFAIQLSVLVVIAPDLFVLLLVAVVITIAVFVEEVNRRLAES